MMPPLVIRIVGLADGTPTAYDGQWLTEYDPTRPGVSPDGWPMLAHVAATADKAAALRLADLSAVRELVMRGSGYIRGDGAPDRPLTAFTIEVESADELAPGAVLDLATAGLVNREQRRRRMRNQRGRR